MTCNFLFCLFSAAALSNQNINNNSQQPCIKCEATRSKPQHIYQGLGGRNEDFSDDDLDEGHENESDRLEDEVARLKDCLDRAKNSISFLKERERKLKDRSVASFDFFKAFFVVMFIRICI